MLALEHHRLGTSQEEVLVPFEHHTTKGWCLETSQDEVLGLEHHTRVAKRNATDFGTSQLQSTTRRSDDGFGVFCFVFFFMTSCRQT